MKFAFLFITLVFAIRRANGQNTDDVVVLPLQVSAPQAAQLLGTLKAGNNATKSNCDYEGLIQQMKNKARSMHGNVVKITRLADPSFIGKCYKIVAEVYYVPDISAYKPLRKNDATPAQVSEYATIYLYRLKDTLALITSYNVHLNNDSVIYFAKKKSCDSVKIPERGPVTLWADIERRTELKVDVKPGETYYVRCGLIKGEIRMNPVLQLVDNNLGATEFHNIAKGKKNNDEKYLRQIH